MVMEFVGGQTLANRLTAGPMPVQEVVDYAIQIADALATAHDAGIIHRDLKPGNIMVTDRGRVKVLDFGLAKRSAFANSASALSDTTATAVSAPLTVAGSILGTVSYMSPEQAEGRTVDARSDIFSFGVVLYEMLTGRRPFTGESTLSILSSILRDEPKSISQAMPAVPGAMDDLVRRCTAKAPAERWQSMHELRDALAAMKTGESVSSRRPRPRPILVVGSVAAAILAGGILWFTRPSHVPASQPVTPLPAPAARAEADVLTNEQVLSMLRAKVAAPVIAQQIRSSRTNFDLSVSAIIRLTEAGAPADLIEIMRDPSRPISKPQPKTAPLDSAATPTVVAPPPAPVAAPSPASPATNTVTVPDALPFRIELAEDVPANAEPGRPIHFTVSQELKIGQTVVVPLHAEVAGEIVDGAKKKLIGGSKLTFRLKTVAAVGGAFLNLRVSPSGRENRRPLEISSSSKPPKGIAAVIGTEYIAYIAGEQTISLSK
jgi:serine/threonine-protein kinase